MKYRIFYENGRWHVKEPSGEVIWHFDSLSQAFRHVNECEGRDFREAYVKAYHEALSGDF